MMKKKFLSFNQLIKKLFRRGKIFRFLLSFLAAVIACSGIAIYFGANGVSASTYRTSWIGNSFPGGNKWVQNYIEGMYVAPNGTIFTNSTWDEGGREAGIYRNGDVVGKAQDLHGWNRLGGKAVTANDKYLYVAMFQGHVDRKDQDYPPEGTDWNCVRRYDLSGKPVPFPEGRGWDKSMLIVSEKNPVTGLATFGKELYVSEEAANRIRVYDTETMKELRSFNISRPGKITTDRQGNLWVIQEKKDGVPGEIVHYSKQGKKLPQVVTGIAQPTAIAIDRNGRLLVTDNGPNQQVLIYNVKNRPVQVSTLGVKGGIFAGTPGEVGNLKLYGLTGIGADNQGNIYVNSGGFNNCNTDLRKFTPQGKLAWKLLGLHFVDNADTDPKSDGVEVYAKHERYTMDYSKPAGKQWTYKAYTVNPFKYPQDPRLHVGPTSVFFRRVQGKPLMYLTDMYNSFMVVYRFDQAREGYIAIPAAMFVNSKPDGKKALSSGDWPPNQPAEGEWIWRDKNGNGKFEANEYETSKDYPYVGGWWVDSKGDIWKTLRTENGIRHFPLKGLDAKGIPIYSYASMEKQANPKIFTDIRRLEYFPQTDTMYISGFTNKKPQDYDDGKKFGSEIARFDNWSKGNTTERWRISVPYDTKADPDLLTASMSAAGDYLFTILVKTAEVYVYNASTGKLVKQFKPGPEVANESGWIDIPYGIRAFQRASGEYLVFAEEDWKAKVIVYRLPAKIKPQTK